jgi:hypothetical protein
MVPWDRRELTLISALESFIDLDQNLLAHATSLGVRDVKNPENLGVS